MSNKPISLDKQIVQQAVGQSARSEETLPETLATNLPSIEQIERELEGFSHD